MQAPVERPAPPDGRARAGGLCPKRGPVASALGIAGAATFMLITPVVAGLAGGSGADSVGEGAPGAVAAVFPPWADEGAAFAAAAAATDGVLRLGAWPWIVVVRNGPGTAAALRNGGAVLVVDAALAAGCGV